MASLLPASLGHVCLLVAGLEILKRVREDMWKDKADDLENLILDYFKSLREVALSYDARSAHEVAKENP